MDGAKGSSQLEDSRKELPSSTPQSGEIEELHFANLVLRVVANTAAVVTGDLALAQTTDLIVNIGAKDSSIIASVDKTLVVRPTLEATVAHEAFVLTSEMK